MPRSSRHQYLQILASFLQRRLFVLATLILVGGLSASNVFAANNPVPFVDIVSPVSITPGSTSVTLTVRGAGFVPTSEVVWNGTLLVTTYVNSQELTAAVPNALVAAVGLGSVVVTSPAPGGGKSTATFIPVVASEASTKFPATPTSSVNVGTTPQGIVTADFNGDGKLDLAVANNGDGTVSILLGNGDGTFTTKSTPSAGSGANWIAVGDFNEDGKPDLAVANFNGGGPGTVSILLGNGDGTFTLHSSPSTGNGPFSLVAGDFNRDGHLDLAVANELDGTVTILLGAGDGTFTPFGSALIVDANPQVIVAGDFNEDGKLDLAVADENSTGTVSVLLGNGDGSFQAQSSIGVGGSGFPIGLIAADFNGDGHLDLAAVNASDVAILLGSGAGGFVLHANPTTGSSFLIAGVAGDYNGDQKLDLVVSDQTAGEAFLLPGVGDGTFGTALTFTTAAGAFGVATADFNGDGGLDLAVSNGTAGNVSIFLQQLPVSLNPTSLSFASQAVGTSSSSQAVVLTNTSGATVHFTSIRFTGTDRGDFFETNTCGISVANNGTCTVNVTFTPTADGSRVATLTIVDDATNNPQTLSVSGVGAAPAVITSANNASFLMGVAGTFTITTTGSPTPTLGEMGTLPSNLTFTDNGNGTATIAGTPAGGTGGTYSLTITAHNGVGSDGVQSFTLTVAAPPSIATAFGAATIPLNGTTSVTLTVTNPNSGVALTGIAFTDSLPAGVVVATPSGLTNTCGGTATAAAGSGSVMLSAGTLAASASCTVSVNVTGTTAGVKNNSVQVTSTEGGTGNTSNASVTVDAPPVIIKVFGAGTIPLNGATTLTFTINNGNGTQSLSGVGFSDTLPAGLVVSTPNGLSGTCGGGGITATAGTSVVSLVGATLGASASCTFSVNVTGMAAGTQNNTTGAVTSTEGGTGGTASASVSVVAAPSMAKVFGPTTIALNGTTSLTFTITNPVANTVALTGVAFTDTLPTGVTVANASATVCGGTVTTTAPTGISLTGASVAANSQCQFSVTVTGAASGQYTNTTGNVTSTNGGTGNTATANLTVASAASIATAFGAATIPLNGTTSVTLTVTNPNSGVALTGIAFTDSLPAGAVVATPSGLTNTCGGTTTAAAGSGSVMLSAGTLAASASCTVTVNVTGTTAGVKNNSVQVTSTEGGTGNTSNASVTVDAPPVIIKVFGAGTIPLNGATTLTFTINNGNGTQSLSGVGFSDTLPAGLVVATPNGLSGTCGGGGITATAGTSVVSLVGATLGASASCTFSVNVTGMAAGTQNNTTGAVTSTEGGTGGTASASVSVVAAPSMAKVFSPTMIALNGTTSLTFTITNPVANTVALTGVAFTDTLPVGVTVANASATVCGGTVTTTAPTGISLTGASVAANSQCQFSVTVTGAASGQYTNTTGNVSATNGGTGNTATANLTVASAASIATAFGAATIPLNGTTSVTLTVTNPNSGVALTGIAFTDSLPAGAVVATPSGLTNTCGGTATAVAGTGSASLTAGTLAASASCTVTVNVTGTTAGVKNNSVQVTSTEGGTGNTSNASVTVDAPPVIIKVFGAGTIPLNGATTLTFTINNGNGTQSLSGVGFSDTLPAGLVVATPNGLSGTCGGGGITATAGTNVVSLVGATVGASASCTFTVNVKGTAAGTQNNTTGAVTSTEGGTGGTASASVSVVAAPSMAKVFGPTTIALNGTTSLTFTITNPVANTVALTGVAFTDTLPSGLVVATPNGLTNACAGTATATAGATGISLTGGSVAAVSSCTVTVNVSATASGQYTNTTGSVTSTNGGTGNTATANLNVATEPAIASAFGAATIPLNGTTSLAMTITNPNSALAFTGVAFTDALPVGLVIATPSALNDTCGGTATATAGSGSVILSAGTLAASGTCAVSVNVTSATTGVKNNSVQVTSNEGGTGNTAASSVTVLAPDLTIAKTHVGNFFQGQNSATYMITASNAGAGSTFGTVTAADTLPVGLTATAMAGTGWTCDAVAVSCTRSDVLAANTSYPAITLTVSVSPTAGANLTNNVGVSGGGEVNVANDTASDATTVTPPPDFSISALSGTGTVNAGQSAMYTFTVSDLNAPFNNAVTLTVSGLPARTSFTFTPAAPTPGATSATSTLLIVSDGGDPFLSGAPGGNPLPPLGGYLTLVGVAFAALTLRKAQAYRFRQRWILLCAGLILCGSAIYGCAGAPRNFQLLRTAPGNYTVTVTGTSGSVQHSTTVTLTVNP